MTGWIVLVAAAAAVLAMLWRYARLDRSGLQFAASAVLLALAGYAWQGSPGLAGRPKAPPAPEAISPGGFAEMRGDLLGRFDTADRWLIIADSYQRRGDTRNAAGFIRSALREHPDNANLWIGYGNALVLHADGMMNPAAELAFRRAAQLAPNHPGPRFFYGLSLAQGGRLDEAEAIWRRLLAEAPPSAAWRGEIERQLALVEQAKAMSRLAR